MTAREQPRAIATAQRLIDGYGGRYSRELGIDVRTNAGVDAWCCAATLFGTRIGAPIAVRTYRTLAAAGVRTVSDAGARSTSEIVELLDAGGYARYDFRTARRLQELAKQVQRRFDGRIASLAVVTDPRELEATLDSLPGWGPTTVRIFLRELRDAWPGAQPTMDERAVRAARHLGFHVPRRRADQFAALRAIAQAAHADVRDLECALIRFALVHRDLGRCPGGLRCRKLAELDCATT